MSSNDIAVSVRGLSKSYTIAHNAEKHTTAAEALVSKLRHPFQKTEKETFWALKDVEFDIQKGDVVGIIGRNGAGKSTLLKILSRITEPTTGQIDLYGRVGSLLEVGTGFHPELTGRENIFLNGAILGMQKSEIARQFDAIVDFSGTEQFIDTPVKRYSSGMYVRLAFAVAAHLNPEILIVDEVLAVGDAEFQKKCLGKMRDVAQGGRTVLFVSHSMEAVSQLTSKCIVLQHGSIKFDGITSAAIDSYIADRNEPQANTCFYTAPDSSFGNYLAWARVHTSHEQGLHKWGEPIVFEFALNIEQPQSTICFSFNIIDRLEQHITHFYLFDADVPYRTMPGTYLLRCEVPKCRVSLGSYSLKTWLSDRRGNTTFENLSGICHFEVTMLDIPRSDYNWQEGESYYIEDCSWHPVQKIVSHQN